MLSNTTANDDWSYTKITKYPFNPEQYHQAMPGLPIKLRTYIFFSLPFFILFLNHRDTHAWLAIRTKHNGYKLHQMWATQNTGVEEKKLFDYYKPSRGHFCVRIMVSWVSKNTQKSSPFLNDLWKNNERHYRALNEIILNISHHYVSATDLWLV